MNQVIPIPYFVVDEPIKLNIVRCQCLNPAGITDLRFKKAANIPSSSLFQKKKFK